MMPAKTASTIGGLKFGQPKDPSPTKAFGYLRVSSTGQVKGDGFTRQHLALQTYCAAHNTVLVRVFKEEGVSGSTENMDRPAWQELMLALHGNGVKTVIVEKLDRLARDLMVQETVIGDLKKHGFTLISTMEPDLCSSDPTRVLVRQVFGAIAQYEKSQLVIKLRGSRARMKANTGHCEGRKGYGHYEGEQAVLERMKSLHAAGLPYAKVASALNTEGLKPRTGSQWYPGGVRRILLAQGEATHE